MRFDLDSSWRMFERIVAAIHVAELSGAKVTLDKKIDGRQFDVAIDRGAAGGLMLIECKKKARPIPVGDVDAFVTKSKDAAATSAAIYSSSGFQEGAKKVARRHSIGLFSVRGEASLPPRLANCPTVEGITICELKIKLKSDSYSLPQENGRMEYLMKKSVVKSDNDSMTLDSIVKDCWDRFSDADEDERSASIRFENAYITTPDSPAPVAIVGLEMIYKLVDMVEMPEGSPYIDPHLFDKMHTSYVVTDEIFGGESLVGKIGAFLGVGTVIKPGKFYSNPNLGNNYYVESIINDQARIFLVESYSGGVLHRAIYRQSIEFQEQFVEIKDKKELARLARLKMGLE